MILVFFSTMQWSLHSVGDRLPHADGWSALFLVLLSNVVLLPRLSFSCGYLSAVACCPKKSWSPFKTGCRRRKSPSTMRWLTWPLGEGSGVQDHPLSSTMMISRMMSGLESVLLNPLLSLSPPPPPPPPVVLDSTSKDGDGGATFLL